MIISHRHIFIFLKTRKTAGTSIESFLRGYLGDDDICTGSERHSVESLNNPGLTGHVGWKTIRINYFRFGVERNPFSKVLSDYAFKKSVGLETADFDDYLSKWVEPGKISAWSLCLPF